MNVSVPLVFVAGVVAYVCYRQLGLKAWHLAVCLLLGFLLSDTSLAPQIHHFLTTFLNNANGGRK